MKVLLSAFACEPNLGSEEGVGWNTVIQAAKYHETWVFTRTFCRSYIEAELKLHPMPNLHFVYFDPFGWSEDLEGETRIAATALLFVANLGLFYRSETRSRNKF
jgi:hypothetical protein